MENTSKHRDSVSNQSNPVFGPFDGKDINAEETYAARSLGELVYVDKFMFVYAWNGRLYCMEPPDDLKDEVTELLGNDVETTLDWDRGMADPPPAEAKHEVDYNPAEVLHLMHELAYSLRELYSNMKDMIHRTPLFEAGTAIGHLNEAHDLLERYKNEYLGGSWNEQDEQDQLYR